LYRERGYHDPYRGFGDRKCARAERLQKERDAEKIKSFFRRSFE
jgi:hypothetical protein